MIETHKKRFSSETSIRVYDDQTGDSVYVGPDADSLDLCELRLYSGEKIVRALAMDPEQAVLVAEAILRLYDEK